MSAATATLPSNTAPTATASADNNTKKKPPSKPTEFNPRWKGYLYIMISSLVNFASVSNLDVAADDSFRGAYVFSLLLGVTTFIGAVLILVTDRFQSCCTTSNSDNNEDRLNYTKCLDGKLEGYTLVAFTIWWIIG